jgi:two-component system, LytTR family, sensor kinase
MPDRLSRIARYLGIWTLIGVFFGTQAMIYAAYSPTQQWQRPMLSALADWYIWAIFAPVILALGRRFPLTQGHRRRSLPVLVVAGFAITLLKIAARSAAGQLIPGLPTMPLQGMLLSQFHLNLATFWAILGIGSAFRYYRQLRERELQTSQLEARLAEARLQVLQMQLQPHFLFNTLHTISAFVQEGEIEIADRMIARLGDLLRLALDTAHTQEVSLRQELEFLQRYLDIQQLRFQERLLVHIDVPEDALDGRVPSLVLQPLVENAIRHGISGRSDGGTVTLSARRVGAELRMEIRDDGIGFDPDQRRGEDGVGLANTRARLEQLYGAQHRFVVESPATGGVCVSLVIPWLEATPASAPAPPPFNA